MCGHETVHLQASKHIHYNETFSTEIPDESLSCPTKERNEVSVSVETPSHKHIEIQRQLIPLPDLFCQITFECLSSVKRV